MNWQTGTLEAFQEQGTKGALLYAVALPGAKRPTLLEQGDLLDILSPDGTLLWSGTFQLRKRRFWERHKLKKGVWANATQIGVSYGQWMEWFGAQPPLRARVLRPAEQANILYPSIDRHLNRPERLRDLSEGRLVGRRVLQWSTHQGTYGMGGPGFFGLELEAKDGYPNEWLTLTIWGAASWLLLNGRWIEAHPKFYDIQKPLFSNFGEEQNWDEVTELLKGSLLQEFDLKTHHCRITLAQGSENHILELPLDTTRLPDFGGTGGSRRWNAEEHLADAWVVTEKTLYV